MIKSFKVTNYLGDSIKLILGEPEKSGFLIKSVEGLGPTKANINTTEIATNDGSRFNSARMNTRNIVFEIIFVETPIGETIEDIRQKSYKYFPLKKKIEIAVETDNRTAKVIGYVESNEPEIFSQQEGTQISIICPDPYFYTEGNVTEFYSVEPIFEFPMDDTYSPIGYSNESITEPLTIFSEIHHSAEGITTYKGDAEIGVRIHIHALGPASNVSIYNVKTRESMKIDSTKLAAYVGSDIIAKDDIIINTMRGNKSITLVREGVSYNILNCLDKNVDWFTLIKGDNTFVFTAESGVTNLQFRIENDVVYEGV